MKRTITLKFYRHTYPELDLNSLYLEREFQFISLKYEKTGMKTERCVELHNFKEDGYRFDWFDLSQAQRKEVENFTKECEVPGFLVHIDKSDRYHFLCRPVKMGYKNIFFNVKGYKASNRSWKLLDIIDDEEKNRVICKAYCTTYFPRGSTSSARDHSHYIVPSVGEMLF